MERSGRSTLGTQGCPWEARFLGNEIFPFPSIKNPGYRHACMQLEYGTAPEREGYIFV